MKKNILLIFGGGGPEHEVSLVSKRYLASQIDTKLYNVFEVEITHAGKWRYQSEEVELNFSGELRSQQEIIASIDLVIPCLHGQPGETGDLQSYLEMIKLPYLGCNSETSKICFNKISTKLWLESAQIATTPFIALSGTDQTSLKRVEDFYDQHGNLFIKASNQGSSIGCFPLSNKDEIADTVMAAFALSPFVVVEKEVIGRELEISVFEYNGEIHASLPGEIICPSKFYSYTEKYDKNSQTKTALVAEGLSSEQIAKLKKMAIDAYHVLKLRHLSRIDFFLTNNNQIYINEINTFPGMTPISMFPKMMENYGVNFHDFINQLIAQNIN
jgi:D-alanine-D-alanine ligase